MLLVSVILLLVASVFVYTVGDLIAQRFFHQSDFSLTNPVILAIYLFIALYYISATLFPIDKIIGRFYPLFGFLLLFGTLLVLVGFFTNGIHLDNIDFSNLNIHPKDLPLIPMFFLTVSCGLLSGFHSTQSTIISRTIGKEKDGRQIFYGMMVVESFIAMVWAAAAYHVYSMNLVDESLKGTANVINNIADVFVLPSLVFVVTIAVVILPVTSGDTALRGLRMILGEALKLNQNKIKNRLVIIFPISLTVLSVIFWAKSNEGSFGIVWRYFNFVNQLISVPTFLYASVYLYKKHKNYLMAFIPAIFYTFVTMLFIFYSDTGVHLSYHLACLIAFFLSLFFALWFYKFKLKKA